MKCANLKVSTFGTLNYFVQKNSHLCQKINDFKTSNIHVIQLPTLNMIGGCCYKERHVTTAMLVNLTAIDNIMQ